MLTQEDIDRFREMEESSPKQLLVIDTQQFFEIEIPADMNAEEFLNSDECREICADRIKDQTTDLNLDRVATTMTDGVWDT